MVRTEEVELRDKFLKTLERGPVAFSVSKVSTGPFSALGLRKVRGILPSSFGIVTFGASFSFLAASSRSRILMRSFSLPSCLQRCVELQVLVNILWIALTSIFLTLVLWHKIRVFLAELKTLRFDLSNNEKKRNENILFVQKFVKSSDDYRRVPYKQTKNARLKQKSI